MPIQRMERLAALVPRPRLHLIRFHGVLAPSVTNDAKLRAMVVPAGPDEHAKFFGAHRARREAARTAGRHT